MDDFSFHVTGRRGRVAEFVVLEDGFHLVAARGPLCGRRDLRAVAHGQNVRQVGLEGQGAGVQEGGVDGANDPEHQQDED